MIGCLRTRVRKEPIVGLYFESENELQFYNLESRTKHKTHTHNGRNNKQNTNNINQITALTWAKPEDTGLG